MDRWGRPIAMLSLGTATPPFRASQEDMLCWMTQSFANRPGMSRLLTALYTHSGIDTRHACVPDFTQPVEQSRLAPGLAPAKTLTTAERMAIYERESVILGAAAAKQALARYGDAHGDDGTATADTVTHLVVVTCTGFFAPGLDLAIAGQLNLAPTVQRTLIGFMGCAAAFNGLRTAFQIVQGQPSARVLVVCLELCSIHIQPGTKRENLVSASLFADGASAALVGQAGPGEGDLFEMAGFHTRVKPETHSEMVWQIGDQGFVLRLSPKIPEHLAEAAPAALRTLFGSNSAPRFWAIHPGGRAIVDRLAEIFHLAPEQVAASRAVLRRFGNMSSATILFVLDEIRRQLRREQVREERVEGAAMAFGPGLVIEMARLTYVPSSLPLDRNGKEAGKEVSYAASA